MSFRFFLVLCAALASLDACKETKEPVSPPSQVGSSSSPRFDGVYVSKVETGQKQGYDLLRFLPNGRVRSVSTTGPLESAAALLYADDASAVGTGTYQIQEGVLRFTLASKQGSVEYAGAVHGDQLAARWRSSINDVSLEEAFTFVVVSDSEPPEQDDGGAGVENPSTPTDADASPAIADAGDAGSKGDVGRKRRQKR